MAKGNVVREDVVQVGFEVDNKGLTKVDDEIKKLRHGLGQVDDSKIEEATKSTDLLANAARKATSTLASLGKVALKGLAVGTAAGAAAVTAITKQSVSAFSDYQQLEGGVQTLFGAGGKSIEDFAKTAGKSVNDVKGEYDNLMLAQDTVMNNASKAFETCGLSANEYMETVTSFSASLTQSLGGDTVKAAEYANMALVDMSDNANKMGTDMGMIQNAYQGFAKQNYTMLDNLKLGYGGTQEEMKRLLADAEKLTGVKYDMSKFGDVVQAINAIQTSMGIAGTTADEAATTISGSANMMRAAWKNVLVDLVNGGDKLDLSVSNLVVSVKTFANNIVPVIKKAMTGIGTVVQEIAPIIARELPGLINDLLPPLINAAASLVGGLVKALPNIVKVLISELPHIAKQISDSFMEAFGIKIPLIEKFGEMFSQNAAAIAKAVPALIGVVGVMKLVKNAFSKVQAVKGLLGKSDGKGDMADSLTAPFQSLAKAKPTTILKAVANIGIIVGGLTVMATALMALAPHISKLSDFGSIMKLIGVIGALGVVGAAMAKLAGTVGNIPVSTVALGLANIAIIVSGMSALYLLIGAVSLINFDVGRIAQIALILGEIGAVGAAMSLFAGIVGMIPVPVVLLGLANIALVLGGLTAVISAYSLLGKIPGFDDFIKRGGETLANLFNVIGNIVGSLIGGVGEGITNSLPAIGENLSAFAKSIEPMFSVFKGVDVGSIGGFFSAIGAFMLQMAGNNILSFFTGGIDFAGIGNQLSAFATSAATFFNTVAAFPENSFSNASSLFQSLADIGNIPCSGGIAQWFSGTIDFASLSNNLPQLGAAMAQFYQSIAGISDFSKISQLFESLAGLKDAFPKEGGWIQAITGSADIVGVGEKLRQFGESTSGFFAMASSINPSNVSGLFEAVQKAGEIAGADFGDLANKGTQLTDFMNNVKGFFDGAVAIVPQLESVNSVALALQSFFATISTIAATSLQNISAGLLNTTVTVQTSTVSFTTLGTSIMTACTTGSTALSALDSKSKATFTAMVAAIRNAMAGFNSAISSGMQTAVTTVQNGANSIKSTLSSINLKSTGENVITGFLNGLKSKASSLMSYAQTLANNITQTMNKALDIGSPSKVTYEIGQFTVQGLINSFKDNIPRVRSTTDQLVNAYTPQTDAAVVNNSTSSRSETNYYSPNFSLTISGSRDDRDMERKVKKWIKEAMTSMIESEMRKAGQGVY